MGTVLAAGQSPATLGMLRHCLVGLLQYRRSFCSPDTPHPKGTAGGITAPVISLSREIKNVQLLKADAQFLNGLKLFYLWLISIRKWSTCKSHMGPEQCTWQIFTCSGWLPLTAGIHSFHTSQALIYSLLLLSNGVGVNQKQNLSVAAGNKKGCVWRQTGQNADQQQPAVAAGMLFTSSNFKLPTTRVKHTLLLYPSFMKSNHRIAQVQKTFKIIEFSRKDRTLQPSLKPTAGSWMQWVKALLGGKAHSAWV